MKEFLAIRDLDTRQVVKFEELDPEADFGEVYTGARRQYPAPRYDVLIGMAQSREDFVHNYPQFRQGGDRGTGGSDGGSIAGQ